MKQEGREGKAGRCQRSGSFSLLTNKGTEEKGCSKASNLCLPQRGGKKHHTRHKTSLSGEWARDSLQSFFSTKHQGMQKQEYRCPSSKSNKTWSKSCLEKWAAQRAESHFWGSEMVSNRPHLKNTPTSEDKASTIHTVKKYQQSKFTCLNSIKRKFNFGLIKVFKITWLSHITDKWVGCQRILSSKKILSGARVQAPQWTLHI